MHIETNQGVVDCPESSLSLDRVIGVLNDALQLFGEGNEEQACLLLAEANRAFDSCLAGGEAGVTPISVAGSVPRRSVEVEAAAEESALATIA
jgi:hypothetical protein